MVNEICGVEQFVSAGALGAELETSNSPVITGLFLMPRQVSE